MPLSLAKTKKMTYFCVIKQLAGLSRVHFVQEESPGNTEHPTS